MMYSSKKYIIAIETILFILFAFSFSTISAQVDPITEGRWINSERNMIIRFYESKQHINAKIVWIKDSTEESGEPKRDIYNESPKLRSRKIIGTNLIEGMQGKRNDTKWTSGTYYYFETGNTYNAQMYLEGEDLYIKGYWWWFKFLGRTRKWERIDP